MADEGTETPLEESTESVERRPRRRPRMSYGRNIDGEPFTKDELVYRIDNQVREERRKRSTWLEQRVIRYAKYRGWLTSKDWPWENASNQHIPIMLAQTLRVEAGLFNAVLGHRPIFTPKPFHKSQQERAEAIGDLIDFQIFSEAEGEQRIEQYINQFCEDGTVVSFQPWVKDRRAIFDTRVVPAEPEGIPRVTYLTDIFPKILPGLEPPVAKDSTGNSWEGFLNEPSGKRTPVEIEVYERGADDDETLELEICIEWKATVHDGPAIVVHQLEDIVVPLRSENMQPISSANPFGAPWVARIIRVDYDTIKRRQKDGTYDELTEEDLDVIRGLLGTRKPIYAHAWEPVEDTAKEQKDSKEGRVETYYESYGGRQWATAIEWYGQLDVNDDGLSEEVIITYILDGQKLCRMRYLTEQYPGMPVLRPFAVSRFIPVPGQFYGIGLPELMEGIHDALHVLVNQNIDAGTVTNLPFFFYRAASGLKPEAMRLAPGEGYPLDNPQQDVAFPQFPQRDQQWSFNMIGLWMQYLDRVTQIGPIQMGQVPQGKASALRTTGTTMAILQQGAAMPEQILRRLFMGLKEIWEQFHLLNMRYLPKNKEYLVQGKPMDQDEAYGVIRDPQDIAIPVTFDFQATLTNTNKGLMSQTLQQLGAAIVSPLMLQLGIVKPENIYNWTKDVITAGQLDPARYVTKPDGAPDGPRHTAEDVIYMIMQGELPEVAPLEPPQEHLAKLQEEIQSDNFGLWEGNHTALLRVYLQRLMTHIQQEQQQQQLMQSAQQFQQTMAQQARGGPGRPPTQGKEAPPIQTQQPTQAEQAGAERSGGA